MTLLPSQPVFERNIGLVNRLAACNSALLGLSTLSLRGAQCKTSPLLQQSYPIAVPTLPEICFSECFPIFMLSLASAQKTCLAAWAAVTSTVADTGRADQDAFVASIRAATFARMLYLANAGLLAHVMCASNRNNVSCAYTASQYDTYLPQECAQRVRPPHPALALIYGFDVSQVLGSTRVPCVAAACL
jgi:hypothetical protein